MGIPGALRPRSNSEILDAAFSLARRFGLQLFPIALLVGLPVSALTLHLSGGAGGGAAHAIRKQLLTIGSSVLIGIFEALRLWVLEAALVEAILNGNVSWPAVWRRLGSVFWRLVGAQAWLVTLGVLCSIPLIVPGMIFILHRLFYSEVLLAEGKSVKSAFRRSFALTDQGLGRVGVLVLGATVLAGALGWGFGFWAHKNLVGAALGWVGGAGLALFKAAFYLLAYYDLRSRREGVDLLARDAALEARSHPEPSTA